MAALLRKRAFSFHAHPHSSHPATPKAGNSGTAAKTRSCNPPLSNRPVVVLSAAVGMQVTAGCRSVGVPSGRQKRVRVVIRRAALLRKRAFSFPARPHSSHPATPEAGNPGAAAKTRSCNPPLSNRPVVVLSAAVGMQVTAGCRSVGVPSGRQKRVRVVIRRAALLRKRAFSFPARPHSIHPATPEARNSGAAAETRTCNPPLSNRPVAVLSVCRRGAKNVSGWSSGWRSCYEKGPFRSPPTHTQATLPHLRLETSAPQQKLAPPCHT